MRARTPLLLSTFAGGMSYALLSRGRTATVDLLENSMQAEIWWHLVLRPLGAAIMISAGLIAGLLYPTRGLTVGILAGIFGKVTLATSELLFPPFPIDSQITTDNVMAYLVSLLMISRLSASAIFGMAGGAFAVALRSHYRIKRTRGALAER